jgi:hypothetical protein
MVPESNGWHASAPDGPLVMYQLMCGKLQTSPPN